MGLHSLCFLLASPVPLAFLWFPTPAAVSAATFAFWFLRAMGQANSNPLVCDLLPANLRSTAVGIQNMAACLAGGMGVMLAGVFKGGFGLTGIFAGVSGLALTAAVLLGVTYFVFLPRDLAGAGRAAGAGSA